MSSFYFLLVDITTERKISATADMCVNGCGNYVKRTPKADIDRFYGSAGSTAMATGLMTKMR